MGAQLTSVWLSCSWWPVSAGVAGCAGLDSTRIGLSLEAPKTASRGRLAGDPSTSLPSPLAGLVCPSLPEQLGNGGVRRRFGDSSCADITTGAQVAWACGGNAAPACCIALPLGV